MLFSSPSRASLLTVFQVSGGNDTNERPGLADKHNKEVAPFVSLTIGQVLVVGSAENQGIVVQDRFSFVRVNAVSGEVFQVPFVPCKEDTLPQPDSGIGVKV